MIFRASAVAATLCIAIAAAARAQDASVSPIRFIHPEGAPDHPPAPKRVLYPKFPHELRATADLGYVAEEAFVDSKGKILSVNLHCTLDLYQKGLLEQEGTNSEWGSWRFEPARRSGTPVNSLVRFSVVFNPASAAEKGPDATPRLLEAKSTVLPDWKVGSKGPAQVQDVVWATVTIDEHGRPIAIRGAPESFSPNRWKSLEDWRFAPARKAGAPVAEDVRVPFIVLPSDRGLQGMQGDVVPPRVISQRRPDYPESMRQGRMRGEVVVQFVVDIEGRVLNPFVVQSVNPEFNTPAVDAVRRWTFDPGKVNGLPHEMQMQVKVEFNLYGVPDGGWDAFTVEKGKSGSNLPERLQVDVEPKVINVCVPVYPYELLRDKVRGASYVSFIVDATGRVAVSRVVSTDRPEFGLALLAAVEQFEYEPALKGGRPNEALVGFKQEFSPDDDMLVKDADYRLLRLEQRHPEQIGGAAGLDSPIKPKVRRAPVYPRSLKDLAKPGYAEIEFLLDEDGSPRLPRVVSASEPPFGYAAAQAVVLWRFTEPRRAGKPVVVRVRIPFDFVPTARGPSPAQSP
jgi:TonB family protein